ncbi:hypothetical protein BDZ94DRAFT_1246786 [Collybia nuda]|uniref:Uncharacterized protein n=1 Tax=Collybia nuda TaxID=64659 RepID=A0A9P5YGY1_9AGAR|nr:hypothetical protein BDZ94DRAFT_1246786 [Collybia nuda]
MSANNSNIPPIFPENDQFDGKNFTAFKTRLLIAAKARGARGYLEGATYTINTTIDAAPTPWTSRTPSSDEWEVRDAWALGLIVFNVKNRIIQRNVGPRARKRGARGAKHSLS